MSLRRLAVLIAHLPHDSNTQAAVNGYTPEQRTWTTTDYLLAAVFDAVQVGNWYFASANSKGTVPKPKPIPRPGAQPQRRTETVSGWQGRTIYTEE